MDDNTQKTNPMGTDAPVAGGATGPAPVTTDLPTDTSGQAAGTPAVTTDEPAGTSGLTSTIVGEAPAAAPDTTMGGPTAEKPEETPGDQGTGSNIPPAPTTPTV